MLRSSSNSLENWQQAEQEGQASGWLLSLNQIEKDDIIGRGSFGVTYLGSLKGEQVAVKSVQVRREFERVNFLRELGALIRARHANLMAFKGAVLNHPDDCLLIVEYLPGGSLKEWLHGVNGRSAPRRSMKEKLDMALGVAKGMAALHALEPPIMHRDLKPSNVMLDGKNAPKVSDFGLARESLLGAKCSLTAETGTYIYMSPEMMRGDSYGLETDVYSFGIVLAEIMRQRDPYADKHLTPMQVATGVTTCNLRPHVTGYFHRIPKPLTDLMAQCWQADPSSRPTFITVVQTLAGQVGKV